MSGVWLGALVVVAIAVLVLVVALWRQGYPDSSASDPDASSGEGPTGDEYPPGSRPAGPEAEDMTEPPSPEEEP